MAVYSLTDHEYRRALSVNDNVTPWITCNLTNSRVEVDGTYTIIDIPDEDIPAGLFQVRVKAIGSRHASAILSNDVPFTGSSFNFGNGIFPDGVNDYLEVETLNTLPSSFSVGFWLKYDFPASFSGMGVFGFDVTSGNKTFIAIDPKGVINNIQSWLVAGGTTGSHEYITPSGLKYFVYNFNSDNTCSLYVNNTFIYTYTHGAITQNISKLQICNNTTNQYLGAPMDEFTVYNRTLTPAEILANYNSGLGANPVSPEDLLLHLKFQEFETLTFPSGSGLGIKDFSGNNNHAKQYNMDTNPSSPNYVLKPFI